MSFRKSLRGIACVIGLTLMLSNGVYAQPDSFKENIYQTPKQKPRDSIAKLNVGDKAPDFTLPAVDGQEVSLSHYRGKKNVVLSFVPAAWTPVCSDQWPGYNLAQDLFVKNNAVLLGITVDNVPTLYSWTKQMCPGDENLWFPVLSDFYPHGAVAEKYGVLRTEGVSERALFVIDKQGIVRYVDVHNINERPPLEDLAKALEALDK
jgi:peroxiredoxin (alkyl hydroperoxide reductase subunit C)